MDQKNVRIDMLVGNFNDPFWGLVLEGTYQAAQTLGVELAITYEDLLHETSDEEEMALLEELLALKTDLLLNWGMPNRVVQNLLDAGVTLVHLAETSIEHPRSFSPVGLYEAAYMAGRHLAGLLSERGRVLLVGGIDISRRAEGGQSRVKGFLDAFNDLPQITIEQVPSAWEYADGHESVLKFIETNPATFDAIFGISDTLAMAARDVLRQHGRLKSDAHVLGINGDLFAFTAIASGTMTATVEASAIGIGHDAVELASRIARGESVPQHYPYRLRLITADNVLQASSEKLFAIAELPTRLVGLDRQMHHERYIQLETSLEINRRVGSILDLKQLSDEISELIRTNYGYDDVQLYRWVSGQNVLVPETNTDHITEVIQLDASSPLEKALQRGTPLFIANTQREQGLALGGYLPDTQSRLILPVHFSNSITHLLDLQSKRDKFHTRQELIGLQSLADQFGIAIRNAELYQDVLSSREEALQSKLIAEKADNLKTRLLANVSHELRTPLNIIIGYSQSALSQPNPYGLELPEKLQADLTHIHDSGEHLILLINDLLDLSRAEIDELDLFIEVINPHKLLEEAFHSIADAPTNDPNVTWRLDLPDHLPAVHVDPLRLRQILINLLSNARKFTKNGEIVLSVDISLPHLHLWVKDTGQGISVDAQEKIFEPFVTAQNAGQRHEGIGLGLTITRRLVALHGGSLSLESQPGRGSAFHVYLPLPSLSDETLPAVFNPNAEPVALLISHQETLSPALAEFCKRQSLTPMYLHTTDGLSDLLVRVQPRVITWDVNQSSPGDWSLIQILRSHPILSQLPFLLLSNDSTSESDQQAGAMMTNVFLKPVHGNTLLKFISAMQPPKKGGILLIVDDDPYAREMYQSMLTREMSGFQVVSLASGAETLDYLSRETPSLILLDLIMPDIDGFKVLEFVRSQPRTAMVPVLVMSGQMLSYEDVKRLNYDRVVFQLKDVLSPEELSIRMNQAMVGSTTLPQATGELVKRALVFIQQNFDRTFTLSEIAHAVGASKNYLSQIFHDEMGLALWDYLNRYRIYKAKELLRTTQLPITEIAMRVGFEDFSYFGRVFNKYCGCSPRTFRQQARQVN